MTTQYQSFPGAPGHSLTLDKLKKLALPDLAGRSFLDVGCNEGFFCGYAKFQGAAQVVGIDVSPGFIERARARFHGCEFHARGWDQLPDGPFDVVLLASALHYADDQADLIHRLVELLSPDGVLVLELGIFSSSKNDWVRVERGIDVRVFPTMAKLREVLDRYAWKWMGPSVDQGGDPVKRHVIHIRRRRRIAYLLMEPPGYGKSTIAASLFGSDGIPIISGDQVLARISRDELQVSRALGETVKASFSPFSIDRLIGEIFAAGLMEALVDAWSALAGEGDFALDAFVPSEQQAAVRDAFTTRGYLPVTLAWERLGVPPLPAAVTDEQAERFYFSLADPEAGGPVGPSKLPSQVTGFVDETTVCDDRLNIRGWAVSPSGFMPRILAVRCGDDLHALHVFQKQQRPDVQRHFDLGHDLLGFMIAMPLPVGAEAASIQVMGGDDAEALSQPFPGATLA
jgi:SAM-dependent methyltransferase